MKKDRWKGGSPKDISDTVFYRIGNTTVCLLIYQGRIVEARGVAICSPTDQFARRTGRAKAQGMAYRAIFRGDSSGEIRCMRFFSLPQLTHPIRERNLLDRILVRRVITEGDGIEDDRLMEDAIDWREDR